ncbi:hypothetical protein J8L70_01320 [Pseudoalteromonas sp. MMG010]|uniref:hypothetical protein n=1 Tax=Pseudoalteromonas sp. MMG010 TaxID=2822685 RepID=UPI001B39DB23|nr:hypothetical protein [Pseudoalteromonas sp. MMG010]MBQ4831873.1 hypothetical protein [Pseudoalteromonas sp. MMG010]
MSASYKIVFSGQVKKNTDLSVAINQLSRLLNIPNFVCEKLFDGKAYALEKNLTSVEAVKKESSLKALGLITKVQPQKPEKENVTPANNNITRESISAGTSLQTYRFIQQKQNNNHLIYLIKNWQLMLLKIGLYFCYTALIIATSAAILTAFKLVTVANDSQINKQLLNYDNYKHYLNNQQSNSPVSAYINNNNTSYEALQEQQQINRYFADFSSAINHYAKQVNQRDVSAMGGVKLKQHLQEIDALGPQFAFWQQLTTLASALENDATNMAKLSNENPLKVQWINAVDWISQSYIREQQNPSLNIVKTTPHTTHIKLQLNLIVLLSFMCFVALLTAFLNNTLKRKI